MEITEINISKKKAEEFANAIFADIDDYVNEQLDEYNTFLEEWEMKAKEKEK